MQAVSQVIDYREWAAQGSVTLFFRCAERVIVQHKQVGGERSQF